MTFSADIITSSTFSTGSLKVTGGAQNGYVLTSDVSGNATWVAPSGGSTPSLSQVLAIGNTSSGNNIFMSNDTYVAWFSGNTFSARIIPDTLTANRSLTIPNNTGTIALTSDITNFANTDLTFSGSRIHNTNNNDFTLTNNLSYTDAYIYLQSGTSSNQLIQIHKNTNTVEVLNNGVSLTYNFNSGLFLSNGLISLNESKGYDVRIKSATDDNLFYSDEISNAIGIGTASPSYRLHVIGTVSTTGFRMTSGAQSGYVLTSDASGNATWQVSSGGVSGTGTASYVTKWSSSTGLTNSIIYDSGTAIGLGTASPSELLHVDGNVRIGGQVYVDLATTLSPSTNSQSIDWNNGNIQTVDFQNAPSGVTFSFSNPKSGGTYTIKIIQGANLTSITWPTSVKWESGTLLLPTQINDAIDIATMVYDGTNYYASFGKNFA